MNIVDCATKKGDNFDPYERISHIGGTKTNGRFLISSEDAIKGIENGNYAFHVNVGQKTVKVIVASRNGRKYLKTESDGYEPNNLLALGDCNHR